jgi:ABC-2 type transport system permease protein
MADDILTVMWKEAKGMFRYRGSRSRFLLMLLSPVLLATVFPLQAGVDWLHEVPALLLAGVVPMILVSVMVPESFAGERERHTLATLLASRLPDRAIFFGKLITPVVFAWGVTLLFLLLSLLVVNLAHGEGELLFFARPIALGSLALSLVMASLTAGAGVLFSLRSDTVQEAAQKLVAVFLVPPMLLQVIPFLFQNQFRQWIDTVNGPQLLAIVVAVLLAIDVLVLLIAMARFRRSQLVVA